MDHQNPTEYLAVKQVKTEYPCLKTGTLANFRYRKEGPSYYKINRKVLIDYRILKPGWDHSLF